MCRANQILHADRTAKEKMQIAEYTCDSFIWQKDFYACKFSDGSALVMIIDDACKPIEFLVIEMD